jgi:hypothetical protein
MTPIILALSLIAAQVVEFDMDQKQQKATGVTKLSKKEKRSLKEWIDHHYAKREQPLADANTPKAPTMQDNYYNGRFIRLSDSSLWEINPEDSAITQGWITPVEIVATPNTEGNYTYKLTNSLTGSSVRARRVTALPKAAPITTQPQTGPIVPSK